MIGLDPPYAREKAALASAIALALRCRAVLRKRHGLEGTSISLRVFGHESDLTCVEMLFTSLLLQGAQALDRTPLPLGEHVAAYRRTWWAGFTSAIAHRLEESERGAAADAEARFAAAGTSAALVLADRSEDSEAALRKAYPRIRNAGRRRLSGGGAGDGWMSGQGADLGLGPRVGGNAWGDSAAECRSVSRTAGSTGPRAPSCAGRPAPAR